MTSSSDMANQSPQKFVDNLVSELQNQAHALYELQTLLQKEKRLLESCDFYHLGKANHEKVKLFSLVKLHNSELHAFKKSWDTSKHQFSLETQAVIRRKIEQLRVIVEGILVLEEENNRILEHECA